MQAKGRKRVLEGEVKSDKMDKTIVVEVSRLKKHHFYGKVTKFRKKYKVHDEKNEAEVGDKVRIIETRPLSRDKRYRLLEIVEKRKVS